AGRVVGYFPSWAIYNQPHPMRIANLPPGKITVLNYAFANVIVDGSGGNTGIKGCTAAALQPGLDISPNQLCPAIQLLDPWADVEDGLAGQPWSACAPQAPSVCGNFADIKTFLAANPSAKAMISIGGWTLSDNFTVVASTPTSRQNFANSVSAFLKGPGSMFSGVDIDWEYPVSGNPLDCCAGPQDRQNFTALLQTLKATLTQNNPGQNLVSFAAPAGAATLQNIDLGTVAQTVDWINLMTYDFNGPFGTSGDVTNFNAPLQYDSAGPSSQSSEVDAAAVKAYLNAGVPASKINLGVPFYGRGYSGVTNGNNGLFQPYTGTGAGCPSSTAQPGMYPYWCLEQSYINQNGYKVYRDTAAGNVPYVFNPSSTAPESGSVMISYDDPASLQAKVAFAKQMGLGGVMIWDLSMDDSSFPLLNTVASALNPLLTGIGGKPTKTTLRETVCSKVAGVPVYAHSITCGLAHGVYRAYVRAGHVRGWRCSPAGQICVQHVQKRTRWARWWRRQVARPAPMR
ncbi:hypothetical protein AYO39_02225, partial [Actinobacteria bacterium SCGC AG-212-D09]